MKMLKECNAVKAINNLSKARGLDINDEALHQLKKFIKKGFGRGNNESDKNIMIPLLHAWKVDTNEVIKRD